MIIYQHGSIFDSDCQTFTCPVNTVGAMGKGLAKQFADEYRSLLPWYKVQCEQGLLIVSSPVLWAYRDPWVLCFATKQDWRKPSQYSYIVDGLDYFASHYEQWGVTSIAFPRLGCGEGGLKWGEIKPLMEYYLDPLPIPVEIYE